MRGFSVVEAHGETRGSVAWQRNGNAYGVFGFQGDMATLLVRVMQI
jgi:hypothetical protein